MFEFIFCFILVSYQFFYQYVVIIYTNKHFLLKIKKKKSKHLITNGLYTTAQSFLNNFFLKDVIFTSTPPHTYLLVMESQIG